MRHNRWRGTVAIYIIIGVLCLTACISIAISDGGSSPNNIDQPDFDKDKDVYIGDNDND